MLALVFCVRLVSIGRRWKYPMIGYVKIDCQSGYVEWAFQPDRRNRGS